MAIGDAAKAAGYGLVPNATEDGKVKYGAREINRTRDYVAQTNAIIPKNKAGYRNAAGITYGTGVPNPESGAVGDIYFRIV